MLSRPVILRLSRVQLPGISLRPLSPGISILNNKTSFPGGNGSHTACIPSMSRLSMHPSSRSVLFHALSQLLSWKPQARIRGKRFLSSQRNVDLSTLIPSTYACFRSHSRPLCYTYSLCSLRAELRVAFDYGLVCPWRVLAVFAPEKVFSDLIEAVLGAIYIDTNGDLKVGMAA